MRLIVDTSSLLWRAILVGKDEEFGKSVEHEGKQTYVNGWQYGLDNAINSLVFTLKELDLVPSDTIFVTEGKDSLARRKSFLPTYKSGRTSRCPEQYEVFNTCKEQLLQTFRDLGSQVAWCDGCEADDVIAYLAKNLQGDIAILTEDGDLSALINERVSLWRKSERLTECPYGPFDPKFVTLYKAMVGDTSDAIPGAKGFGPKAWLDLLVNYNASGLAAIEGMIQRKTLHELEEDVADFKPFRKVVDGADLVYASYNVAKLRPEWVNTLRQPLQWQAGMVKPCTDSRLRSWGQQVRLVTAGTYPQALEFFKQQVKNSPIVALDIETSTPEESDEWLERREKQDSVDVFGSELTGMGLTFGRNNNFTYYLPCDHANTGNLSTNEIRAMVEAIPQGTPIIIQNFSFEGPICWGLWGQDWKDNGFHGFLPNVIDTKILANYVDENVSSGLKQGSKLYLDYEQASYMEVTQGRKMRELSGEEVLSYGTDDTICTAALYNHFKLRTEIEGTWNLINEIEIKPAYLTAYAFTQGTKFSLQRMGELERADARAYDEAWSKVRQFLMDVGWEGTKTPSYEGDLTPAQIKEIVQIILGQELKTMVRTPSKLAKLVEVMDHDDAPLLAHWLTHGDLKQINDRVKHLFTGEPAFDLNSPKQVKHLLYDVLDLPVRLVNSCTQLEREKKPQLAQAVQQFKRIANGSKTEAPLTAEQKDLIKTKARSDDTAMEFALKFDGSDIEILHALQTMKSCDTKAKMFYRPYRNMCHWKDGRIHAQINQCATVTRRWSSSSPNLQQLPKTKGVVFRECYVPHKKDAVICSVDFSGQELRLQAGLSGDIEMLGCYVGDNLRDIHSITASGAMKVVWDKETYDRAMASLGNALPATDYDTFLALLKSEDKEVTTQAKALRNLAKGVNFGSAYGCEAPKLQELLVTDLVTATKMLDAKLAKFSGYESWKEKVERDTLKTGYAATKLGGRRHLREAILSDDKWRQQSAARQASNFEIQSAGAELAKKAMSRIWDSGIFFKLDARFIAVIHDEVVWSVHRDDAYESIKVVWEAVSQPYTPDFPVPFIGSISLGPNFGQQYEAGEKPDANVIAGILDKCFAKTEVSV